MAKLKQSIAVLRQIPEHIRTNYPLFVEFLRAYYEFLEQSQQQDLQSIHDIDTVLDEFVFKFKDEIAKNFPIELLSDKRLVMKHLREFYLSRGSEDSYKFLFRVLFAKEASISYPGTEILRVSDGRWKQDVSIFVVSATGSAINATGKYITITNSRGKKIRTYCESTAEYNPEIYEVFIQRDYVNELNIGATVTLEDGTILGTIVPCPSKLNIYKPGSGFKVGEIFALKSQIGRGCVVKIIKVGSNGEILKIQVIKFGLDYESKFYSYLSSKKEIAYEYVNPAIKVEVGQSASPGYTDPTDGFVDYGWASKQTYFYYDENIPIGDPSYASDRFYADSSYVGDVVQQFYTDATNTQIDESLAIIEIELGAVAKYPGYFSTANGFISDQMYIQDGNYYQAFSYVIKVEEELRRYADIVKALVHPAGMKLFSEYNIYNQLQLSYTQPKAFLTLQLPVYDREPSIAYALDQGYGLDANGNQVLSEQGKAALFNIKNISDTNIVPIEDTKKSVDKSLLDSITEYVELIEKSYSKKLDHSVATSDSGYGLDANGNQVSSDPGKIAWMNFKNLSDSIINIESQSKDFTKALEEYITDGYTSVTTAGSEWVMIRNYNEVISKDFTKALEEDISTADSGYGLDANGNQVSSGAGKASLLAKLDKNDTINFVGSDSNDKNFTRTLQEEYILDIIELVLRNLNKELNDGVSTAQDFISILRTTLIEENIPILDTLLNELKKTFADEVFASDVPILRNILKELAESINITTNGRVRLNSYDNERYFIDTEDYQNETASVVSIT